MTDYILEVYDRQFFIKIADEVIEKMLEELPNDWARD